jgi:hypothetical protein
MQRMSALEVHREKAIYDLYFAERGLPKRSGGNGLL